MTRRDDSAAPRPVRDGLGALRRTFTDTDQRRRLLAAFFWSGCLWMPAVQIAADNEGTGLLFAVVLVPLGLFQLARLQTAAAAQEIGSDERLSFGGFFALAVGAAVLAATLLAGMAASLAAAESLADALDRHDEEVTLFLLLGLLGIPAGSLLMAFWGRAVCGIAGGEALWFGRAVRYAGRRIAQPGPELGLMTALVTVGFLLWPALDALAVGHDVVRHVDHDLRDAFVPAITVIVCTALGALALPLSLVDVLELRRDTEITPSGAYR